MSSNEISDEFVELVSKRILREHFDAFKELAKGDASDNSSIPDTNTIADIDTVRTITDDISREYENAFKELAK